MKLKLFLTSVAAFMFSFSGRASTAPDPISEFMLQTNSVDSTPESIGILSDSGAQFPTYQKLTARMKDLAVRHSDLAHYIEYGSTVQGRKLSLVKMESKAADLSRRGRPAVQISGAIHGNEYLAIEEDLLVQMIENHDRFPGLSLFLSAGGVIYFVPVVNPDGFERRNRANSHGKDLNRDWDVPPADIHLFKEPESTSLARYLESDLTASGLKYDFSVDYHCCLGAMITPWTYKNAYPSQNEMRRYNEVAAIQKSTLGFPVGNAMDTVRYNAVGGTIDYFFSKYGTTAFAIEGQYGGEGKRLLQHLQFFDGVFQKLATASILR